MQRFIFVLTVAHRLRPLSAADSTDDDTLTKITSVRFSRCEQLVVFMHEITAALDAQSKCEKAEANVTENGKCVLQ